MGRTRQGWLLVALVLSASIVPSSPAPAAATPPLLSAPAHSDRLFVPDEVIVRFKAGTTPSERADTRGDLGGTVAARLEIPRAQVIDIPDGATVADAVADYEADPAVDFAEPNFLYEPLAVPNDPLFSNQWALQNTGQTITPPLSESSSGTTDADIDAPQAWNNPDVFGGDASDVIVAVVDLGIAPEAPEIEPNLWVNPGEIDGNSVDDDNNGFVDDVHGFDFDKSRSCEGGTPECQDPDPTDHSLNQHGIAVTGAIGARGNDGYGTSGVAQRVQLMGVKIFDPVNRATLAAIGNGMKYAADNGADIVNLSFGGPCPSELAADVIASHPETLFVAGAGNGASDGIGDNNDIPDHDQENDCDLDEDLPVYPGFYPCSYNDGPEASGAPELDFPNVLCVAASDQNDAKTLFSDYGATSVDIAAPGERILSTQIAYQSHYSTSFEDGTFAGQWVDSAGSILIPEDEPPTPGPDGGWRRVGEAVFGDYALSDSDIGVDYAPDVVFDAQMGGTAPTVPVGTGGCFIVWLADLDVIDGDGLQLFGTINDAPYGPALHAQLSPTDGWQSTRLNIVEAAEGNTVRFAFRFISNGTDESEGVKIDEFNLLCLGGDYENPAEIARIGFGTHLYTTGTSMSTPLVSGIAALVKQQNPDFSGAELKEAVLAGGDPVSDFAVGGSTPVATGDRVNAADALRRPTFTFKPASPANTPTVTVEGDAPPNISDYATAQLFTNDDCSGAPAATGSKAAFTGSGLEVDVPDDDTTDITARFVDEHGNRAVCSHEVAFVEDSTAPATLLTTKPPKKTFRRTARFRFSAAGASGFQCKLDGGGIKKCKSPKRYKNLAVGRHTFRVRAVDVAGNRDSFVRYVWRIKRRG